MTLWDRERPVRLQTMEAISRMADEQRNPAFWLAYPELLVSDQCLLLFEEALQKQAGADWLRVSRPDGRFVIRIDDERYGMFLKIEPDYMVATLTNEGRIVAPGYWDLQMKNAEKELASAREELRDVREHKRSTRLLKLGSMKWHKKDWEERLMKLEKQVHLLEKKTAEYEHRRQRAGEIQKALPMLKSLLLQAGYELRDNKWGHLNNIKGL